MSNGICCPQPGPGLYWHPLPPSSDSSLQYQDREMQVLCAPDGSKVVVQNVTSLTAALGTAPTFEAWNLDGTPYLGLLAALTDCAQERVDITKDDFCASGQEFTRVTVWDVTASPMAAIGTVWQDATGAVVAAPAGAVKGPCGCAPVAPVGVVSTWG